MVDIRSRLGLFIALALHCVYMNEHRTLDLLCILEKICYRVDIVSVDRAEICKAHLFKQCRWEKGVFNDFLYLMVELIQNASEGI